jgi:hypothetical protein
VEAMEWNDYWKTGLPSAHTMLSAASLWFFPMMMIFIVYLCSLLSRFNGWVSKKNHGEGGEGGKRDENPLKVSKNDVYFFMSSDDDIISRCRVYTPPHPAAMRHESSKQQQQVESHWAHLIELIKSKLWFVSRSEWFSVRHTTTHDE